MVFPGRSRFPGAVVFLWLAWLLGAGVPDVAGHPSDPSLLRLEEDPSGSVHALWRTPAGSSGPDARSLPSVRRPG
ncbi:MAG: hypothetical protein KatS3mg076_0357 [Candidatus Binatia bacterium]|nr:MAG: hypothetical protein KatS3mg076_0357 [Candidatus Binatia bacterium]